MWPMGPCIHTESGNTSNLRARYRLSSLVEKDTAQPECRLRMTSNAWDTCKDFISRYKLCKETDGQMMTTR